MGFGEAAQGMGWNSCGPGLNNLHPCFEIAAQQFNYFHCAGCSTQGFTPGLNNLHTKKSLNSCAGYSRQGCRFFNPGPQLFQPMPCAASPNHISLFFCFLLRLSPKLQGFQKNELHHLIQPFEAFQTRYTW